MYERKIYNSGNLYQLAGQIDVNKVQFYSLNFIFVQLPVK